MYELECMMRKTSAAKHAWEISDGTPICGTTYQHCCSPVAGRFRLRFDFVVS